MDRIIISMVTKHVAEPIGANLFKWTSCPSGISASVERVRNNGSRIYVSLKSWLTSSAVTASLALLKSKVA
jgi:hypothetical protein